MYNVSLLLFFFYCSFSIKFILYKFNLYKKKIEMKPRKSNNGTLLLVSVESVAAC